MGETFHTTDSCVTVKGTEGHKSYVFPCHFVKEVKWSPEYGDETSQNVFHNMQAWPNNATK